MVVGASDIILGAPAPSFSLPATDGRTYALNDVAGEKGAVIVFICNHCPYVRAVIDRLVADARVLMGEGVGFAAICSNDAASYPEDCFANMREFAKRHDFAFPYLHGKSQDVARAYGALCTPDFFGYDRDLKLRYRGRLDEGRTTPPPPERAPRAPRGHARHRRDRRRAGDPGSLDRLLDQMEGRTGPVAAIDDRRGPESALSARLERPPSGGASFRQLVIGPLIAFSAASICRQVFASSLSFCCSDAAARWAASATARAPWASSNCRASSVIAVSSMDRPPCQ